MFFRFQAVVSASAAGSPKMFKYNAFPFVGGVAQFTGYLQDHFRKKEDWHHKCSDFNFLVQLPGIIGLEATLLLCDAVRDKKAVTQEQRAQIEKAFKTAGVAFA